MLLVFGLLQAPKQADAASSWPRHAVVRSHQHPTPGGPPPGFHAEQRPFYAVIVVGAVLTGMGALLVGTGAAIASARVGTPDQREYQAARDNASVFTALGLAHLGVGLPLLTVGLLARRTVYVPDQAVSFTFVPIVSADRMGGAFTLSF